MFIMTGRYWLITMITGPSDSFLCSCPTIGLVWKNMKFWYAKVNCRRRIVSALTREHHTKMQLVWSGLRSSLVIHEINLAGFDGRLWSRYKILLLLPWLFSAFTACVCGMILKGFRDWIVGIISASYITGWFFVCSSTQVGTGWYSKVNCNERSLPFFVDVTYKLQTTVMQDKSQTDFNKKETLQPIIKCA